MKIEIDLPIYITDNGKSEYGYYDEDKSCWVSILRRGDGYEERWEGGRLDKVRVSRIKLEDLPIQQNFIYKEGE